MNPDLSIWIEAQKKHEKKRAALEYRPHNYESIYEFTFRYALRISDGIVETHFWQKNGVGRLNAIKGMSYQCMTKSVRYILCCDTYVDIDMVNAHPTILYQYCDRKGIECCFLKDYVLNRDRHIQDILMLNTEMTRDDVKQIFISLLYGGKRLFKQCKYRTRFLDQFASQVAELTAEICEQNKELLAGTKRKRVKKGKNFNHNGATLSFLLQNIENRILMCMEDVASRHEFILTDIIPMHDGCMLLKRDGFDYASLLREMEGEIFGSLGYKIKLIEKPMFPSSIAFDLVYRSMDDLVRFYNFQRHKMVSISHEQLGIPRLINLAKIFDCSCFTNEAGDVFLEFEECPICVTKHNTPLLRVSREEDLKLICEIQRSAVIYKGKTRVTNPDDIIQPGYYEPLVTFPQLVQKNMGGGKTSNAIAYARKNGLSFDIITNRISSCEEDLVPSYGIKYLKAGSGSRGRENCYVINSIAKYYDGSCDLLIIDEIGSCMDQIYMITENFEQSFVTFKNSLKHLKLILLDANVRETQIELLEAFSERKMYVIRDDPNYSNGKCIRFFRNESEVYDAISYNEDQKIIVASSYGIPQTEAFISILGDYTYVNRVKRIKRNAWLSKKVFAYSPTISEGVSIRSEGINNLYFLANSNSCPYSSFSQMLARFRDVKHLFGFVRSFPKKENESVRDLVKRRVFRLWNETTNTFLVPDTTKMFNDLFSFLYGNKYHYRSLLYERLVANGYTILLMDKIDNDDAAFKREIDEIKKSLIQLENEEIIHAYESDQASQESRDMFDRITRAFNNRNIDDEMIKTYRSNRYAMKNITMAVVNEDINHMWESRATFQSFKTDTSWYKYYFTSDVMDDLHLIARETEARQIKTVADLQWIENMSKSSAKAFRAALRRVFSFGMKKVGSVYKVYSKIPVKISGSVPEDFHGLIINTQADVGDFFGTQECPRCHAAKGSYSCIQTCREKCHICQGMFIKLAQHMKVHRTNNDEEEED